MKVMNLQTESLKRWKYHSHLFKGLDKYVTRCCALIISAMILVTPALANDYALDFDGSNDYVTVEMSLPTGDFTYSAWVKYDSNNDETLFMASSGNGTNEFLMYSGSSGFGGAADILIATNNSVRAFSNDNWLTTGVWHHIAATRSGSTVKLYGDGVLKDSGTDATALSFGSCDLLIGVDADAGCVGSLANFLNGQIDEIRIWNIARTQQEILNNMNIELAGNESGLVAYYKMSDGSGATLTDNSSNSNDGTLTNMVTSGASSDWVTATSPVSSNGDYSLNFDGSNDYVKTGGVFSDLGVSNQSYTISAWIKVSTVTDGDIIWMSSLSNGDGWCLPPLSIDNSKIRAYSFNNTDGGFAAYDTENITTNIWYHAVTTWDATNGLRLFVDGDLKSTNSTLTYNASGVSNYIWFGYGCCSCVGMQGYFNGAIDDVGIWNTALDADAILAIYNSGTPINLTSNSGNYDEYTDNLKGYWRFSENNGTTAYDISGNANHGTLTNGPTYTTPGAGLWIYSTATGNWNSTSTWSYGVVPTSSKSVRIKHDVTLNTSPTIVALTVDASKTLTCGSYTLTATGASDINGTVTLSTGIFDANSAFDATGGAITFSGAGSLNLAGAVTGLGTFTESTSTVTYDGTTQTIDGDDYYNLILSGGTKTLGGNITVNGDLTNNANAALSMSTYNVSIGGDLTIANGATWTKGSGTVTFNAASNQTLTDNNGTPQNLGTVVVD